MPNSNSRICRCSATWTAAVACLLASASAGRAESVGYQLSISEGLTGSVASSFFQLSQQLKVAADCPLIVLTNTSDAASITAFELTIGDTSYNFDALMFITPNPGIQVTSFSPDTVQGALRADLLGLAFAGFTPGQEFGVRTDVDLDADNGLSFTNFRKALVGASDPANRAHVKVTFSNDTVLTDILSPFDELGNTIVLTSSFRCAPTVSMGSLQTGNSMVVPEPAAWGLALAGAVGSLGCGLLRRRASQRAILNGPR